MKLFSLVALLLSFSAQAAVIDISPKNPIDCLQKAVKDVAYVESVPMPDEYGVIVKLNLTYGTCNLGNTVLKPIASDFNLYLIGAEYSRDFGSAYSVTDPQTVSLTMHLNPEMFFQLTNTRHFDLSFYPSSGALEFGWSIVISRDPVTNKIYFQAVTR